MSSAKWHCLNVFMYEQLETHGCMTSTTATAMLKYQAISIHSADQISIVLGKISTKILHFRK